MSGLPERTGRCLCGAVRVSTITDNRSVAACHCGMCRRWTGGPMLAFVCGAQVRFEGEDSIAVFESSERAERGFCRRCGSHLYYRRKGDGGYILPVGLLDDSEDLAFEHQIFIDEKPSLYSFSNETRNLTGAEVLTLRGSSPE